MFNFEAVEDWHADIFANLADGVIHGTTAEAIKAYLAPDFPPEKVSEYLEKLTPSKNREFKEIVKETINSGTSESTKAFILFTTILGTRILSPLITNSVTLVEDMTIQQKESLLRVWRDSPFETKRKLFRASFQITVAAFVRTCELHQKAVSYPGRELRETLYEDQQIDTFKYTMLKKPVGDVLSVPDIDVLIIGSGSGAGVVAHTLAQEGYISLVLEKGKYYSRDQFNFGDKEGYKNLYQNKGVLPTINGQMTLLAGSTFGGGSTVNWLASLKTPFKVRKEWYEDYGLEWAASEDYDNSQAFVYKTMGVTTENIKHSFGNNLLKEASAKLGYPYKDIPQNSGSHPDHSCGFCHLGCKYGIKQGSVECWFRDAAAHGSQFMDEVRVIKIIHDRGKAVAVLCEDVSTGKTFKIVGPKKFVVAGGALNSPIILQNSGFTNKNIGKNLKLHPVTLIFGDFGQNVKTDPSSYAPMTALCNKAEDLDGKAHGCKIEIVLSTPATQAVFLPWDSSDKLLKDLLSYQHLVPVLLIARDTSSGSVTKDPKKKDSILIDYAVNKFDRNALLQGSLIAADLLYIEGAQEIFTPQAWIPRFKSSKPKEDRSIDDKDYNEWRTKISKTYFDTFATAYSSAHQMSTVRMSGKGPGYGACDERGRLFESSNIYVADSSAMPTASGVNPMVSTMSIARLVALGLSKDLKKQAKL
ncbi:long chain fatty acid oxidase [Scheffersomyces xylosifermentans]|uniref:long chain fatty acid oxidase n=1 Tax=Scheffersomyces xylosifermentans TaxID=1304137 RepID=UPI00315C9348